VGKGLLFSIPLRGILLLMPNIEHFPYLGLFLLLLLGGVGLPFPEDATLILCGILISTEVVKPIPALIIVYAGLLIADLILHFIGKKYGRRVVTHRRFHKLISPERLSYLEEKFTRRGILIILLGRHVAGLRAQIFLVSGIMRMPALKFLLTDAVSALFTMALMIGAGYWGGNALKFIKQGIVRIEHIAIWVIIVSIIIYSFFRYLKPRLTARK
jgi:membrane protein DedA with SNARE-associated domain